jgi:hypothetical protein
MHSRPAQNSKVVFIGSMEVEKMKLITVRYSYLIISKKINHVFEELPKLC